MATVDVTVMGAGIFGLSVAYACAKRGAYVRVIDRQGIAAGASGGVVGALAPHVPENWNAKKAFQLDSLLMAESYWAKVDALSGQSSGYGRLGRLQSLPDDRAVELAKTREASAKLLWRDHAKWQVVEAEQFEFKPVSATGFLAHDTLSARLHPLQACQSLAGALQNLGAEIIVGDAPALGQVVWATGHQGLLHLNAGNSRAVGNGVKGQAVLLDHDAKDMPQLFADGLHIIPHADGTTAIGSTSERDFADPTSTDEQIDALLDKALAVCPILQKAKVLKRWAGVRPRSRSRAPMLGHWPGKPGHFIANGGFKIGFGMAPKVGEVMADLVLDDIDSIPDGFRVEDSF